MKTAVPNSPDYTYGNNYQELEPYMLYGDRSIAESPIERKDMIVKDLEYLQGMYPGHMKRLQEYVVSACDHLDYKNSPMYDEFPDRILINQICDSICRQIHKDGAIADEEITGSGDAAQAAAENQNTEEMGWEANEIEGTGLPLQQRYLTWGLPSGPPSWEAPPWGPPPGSRPLCWGPPPGKRPPHWGPPPGKRPPYWGPPYGSRLQKDDGSLNDVISVLLLNEMHRRRCRSGHCR